MLQFILKKFNLDRAFLLTFFFTIFSPCDASTNGFLLGYKKVIGKKYKSGFFSQNFISKKKMKRGKFKSLNTKIKFYLHFQQ